jgi:hypothetical protein
MKPTAILSMDIRYHKSGMETMANPVLFDRPDFKFPKSKLFGKGLAPLCARPLGTLEGREVFSGTHMSRRKTYLIFFRRCDGETLRGFLTL